MRSSSSCRDGAEVSTPEEISNGYGLLEQSAGNGHGFLPHREHFLQLVLGLGQLLFLELSALTILGEPGFDFVGRCFRFDGLLQGFGFRAGLGPETLPTRLIAGATATA